MILKDFPNLSLEKLVSDILEYGGHSYLVIIDYYSNWIETIKLEGKTSQAITFDEQKCLHVTENLQKFMLTTCHIPKECQDFARSWASDLLHSALITLNLMV